MDFTKKKLPLECAGELRVIPIHTVKPFLLMPCPVYIFMRLNEKFVSVKAPLDYFEPPELTQLLPYESFFFTSFIDQILPFRTAARSVLRILTYLERNDSPKLLPPPFEISDKTLKLIGPLWGEAMALEPFFITAFVNELCEHLPVESMKASRDSDMPNYETAIFRSSFAVFLGLHIGYCNLQFLNALRVFAFSRSVSEGITKTDEFIPVQNVEDGPLEELYCVARKVIPHNLIRVVEFQDLNSQISPKGLARVMHQWNTRMQRVQRELVLGQKTKPSIFGKDGFIENISVASP